MFSVHLFDNWRHEQKLRTREPTSSAGWTPETSSRNEIFPPSWKLFARSVKNLGLKHEWDVGHDMFFLLDDGDGGNGWMEH